MTINKNNAPFITFTPSLIKNGVLINKEIPVIVKKSTFLPLKNKQESSPEQIQEIKASIHHSYYVSHNIHISQAIQSLGGVSILFPLLSEEIIQPNDAQFVTAVFHLMKEAMKYASAKDWQLFSECLSRVDEKILGEQLPHFLTTSTVSQLSTDIFNNHICIQCIKDMENVKVEGVLERCLQCLNCEDVSDSTKLFDSYAEWCVKERETLALAWSQLIGVEDILQSSSHYRLFIRLLTSALKKQSEVCSILLPLLPASIQSTQTISLVIQSLQSLEEYQNTKFGIFTPFLYWLHLCNKYESEGLSDLSEWRRNIVTFMLELFEYCHKSNKWNEVKIDKAHCMVILYFIKKNTPSHLELSLPHNFFFRMCIQEEPVQDEASLSQLVSYFNWFLVVPSTSYQPMFNLLFQQYSMNQSSNPLLQTLLFMFTFIQSEKREEGYDVFISLLAVIESMIQKEASDVDCYLFSLTSRQRNGSCMERL